MTFEVHITFKGEYAERVKRHAPEVDGKFSMMTGDPVLGSEQKFCYLTAHFENLLHATGWAYTTANRMRRWGVYPLRAKIEVDIYDERY